MRREDNAAKVDTAASSLQKARRKVIPEEDTSWGGNNRLISERCPFDSGSCPFCFLRGAHVLFVSRSPLSPLFISLSMPRFIEGAIRREFDLIFAGEGILR